MKDEEEEVIACSEEHCLFNALSGSERTIGQ